MSREDMINRAAQLFGERADLLAEKFASKLFSGRRANNVEVHLDRQTVKDIVSASFLAGAELGLEAGLAANAPDTTDTKERP